MRRANYLIFGDLHGRVLPAFKQAQAWWREHGVTLLLAGLRVGALWGIDDRAPRASGFRRAARSASAARRR